MDDTPTPTPAYRNSRARISSWAAKVSPMAIKVSKSFGPQDFTKNMESYFPKSPSLSSSRKTSKASIVASEILAQHWAKKSRNSARNSPIVDAVKDLQECFSSTTLSADQLCQRSWEASSGTTLLVDQNRQRSREVSSGIKPSADHFSQRSREASNDIKIPTHVEIANFSSPFQQRPPTPDSTIIHHSNRGATPAYIIYATTAPAPTVNHHKRCEMENEELKEENTALRAELEKMRREMAALQRAKKEEETHNENIVWVIGELYKENEKLETELEETQALKERMGKALMYEWGKKEVGKKTRKDGTKGMGYRYRYAKRPLGDEITISDELECS